jgi:hypothetical protein
MVDHFIEYTFSSICGASVRTVTKIIWRLLNYTLGFDFSLSLSVSLGFGYSQSLFINNTEILLQRRQSMAAVALFLFSFSYRITAFRKTNKQKTHAGSNCVKN